MIALNESEFILCALIIFLQRQIEFFSRRSPTTRRVRRKSEFLIKEILFDMKRNANFLDKQLQLFIIKHLAFFHFEMQLHAMRPRGICISNPICKMELKMLQEFFIYVMPRLKTAKLEIAGNEKKRRREKLSRFMSLYNLRCNFIDNVLFLTPNNNL